MSDDRSTFETTRARLEDIVVQVRRKDVSLEQSLDMLEEAVRLVNQCNELIDQTSFRAPTPAPAEGSQVVEGESAASEEPAATAEAAPAEEPTITAEPAESVEDDGADEGEDASVESVEITETFEMIELDGEDLASIEFVQIDEVVPAGAPADEIEDDERS